MTPCTNQEVGQSGVFWTLEKLAVPKSTFFPDELAYRRQVSKNEGTYMGGIEIGQVTYMAHVYPSTVKQCSLGFVAQKIFEEAATPAKFRPEVRARRPKKNNGIFVPFCTPPVPDLVEHRTR